MEHIDRIAKIIRVQGKVTIIDRLFTVFLRLGWVVATEDHDVHKLTPHEAHPEIWVVFA